MKLFRKSYWLLLLLYFVISCLLLTTNASHHDVSLLPYILILLPFLLLFWNPAKKHDFSILGILLLVLFVVFHATPIIPLVQSHHQSSSHEMHPCCMPQIADAVIGHISAPFLAFINEKKEDPWIIPYIVYTGPLTTRAPPYNS
jgi:hypothetical protein